MIRNLSIALTIAACLLAAVSALGSNSHKPASGSAAYTGRGQQAPPRYVKKHGLDGCFVEPYECGFVVW